MNENDVFNKLAAKWNLPGSQGLIRLMEIGITPDEGELLLELNWWTTPQELAKKLNVDEETIQPKLEGLMKRGWVRARKGTYNAAPNMLSTMPVSALPGVPVEKLNALWTDFYRSGDYQRWSVDAWIIRLAATGHAVHRVIPAMKALRASPNLRPDQILWYEDMEIMLKKAKVIHGGRGAEACGCRRIWGICESPVGCMGWSYEDRPMRAGSRSKQLTAEEALAMVDEAEEYGNVNVPANCSETEFTCFCCPCCCHVLNSSLENGRSYKNYNRIQSGTAPSRFLAVIDQELCDGCQTCVERCHFNAVEMEKMPGSKKLKAHVIAENCMGCGLCVFKCPQNAIRFEVVRPPEFIPTLTRMEQLAWDTLPVRKGAV
jgi:NAD-dependent dihydropyrimidine dehydrogenase PreA subunit